MPFRDAGEMEVRPPKGHMSGQSSGQCDVGIGCLEEAEDVLSNIFGFKQFLSLQSKGMLGHTLEATLCGWLYAVSLFQCVPLSHGGLGGH